MASYDISIYTDYKLQSDEIFKTDAAHYVINNQLNPTAVHVLIPAGVQSLSTLPRGYYDKGKKYPGILRWYLVEGNGGRYRFYTVYGFRYIIGSFI